MTVESGEPASFENVRLPKMAELVANRLRRQIVRGELVEDQALPSETELMAQFKVSRPTLREAFRVLESESLITVRRGARGGARVRVPDTDVAARYAGVVLEYRGTTLDDVYEARIIIEPSAVGLLASRRTSEDVARLRAALEEHDALVGDPQRSIRVHTAFHALLMDLTGNETLRVLTAMIERIVNLANWNKIDVDHGTPEHAEASRRGLGAHHRVVDLIDAGIASGAEELWRKHLTEARQYLLRPDVTTVLDLMQ